MWDNLLTEYMAGKDVAFSIAGCGGKHNAHLKTASVNSYLK